MRKIKWKTLLFIAWDSAHQRKTARGLLPAPAWAPGPATTGWAGEAAQRHPPPGLILAHTAALLLTAVDLQIDG
jgi:hypothetical protein